MLCKIQQSSKAAFGQKCAASLYPGYLTGTLQRGLLPLSFMNKLKCFQETAPCKRKRDWKRHWEPHTVPDTSCWLGSDDAYIYLVSQMCASSSSRPDWEEFSLVPGQQKEEKPFHMA